MGPWTRGGTDCLSAEEHAVDSFPKGETAWSWQQELGLGFGGVGSSSGSRLHGLGCEQSKSPPSTPLLRVLNQQGVGICGAGQLCPCSQGQNASFLQRHRHRGDADSVGCSLKHSDALRVTWSELVRGGHGESRVKWVLKPTCSS